MTDIQTALHNLCRELAESAHNDYCRQITPVIYLWGTKGGEGPFDDKSLSNSYVSLELSRGLMPGREMVISEHVPRHLTVDQLKTWFLERLRREPIVPALNLEPADH